MALHRKMLMWILQWLTRNDKFADATRETGVLVGLPAEAAENLHTQINKHLQPSEAATTSHAPYVVVGGVVPFF